MKEREEMFHKEYDEKLSALQKRALEERDQSEEARQELVSARMEIDNLKMELAKVRRVDKQAEGPVVTESLKKITEGECHFYGSLTGEVNAWEWNGITYLVTFHSKFKI